MQLSSWQFDTTELPAAVWDVVIVGGGMGGGAAANALSSAGHRVLLLEKGLSSFDVVDPASIGTEPENPADRLSTGRWPMQLRAVINGLITDLWAPLGCGLGGSTTLYAATLERLDAQDFALRRTPAGEDVSWPFSYSDIEPYYRQVEDAFGVRGTPDPLEVGAVYALRDPPAMNECDRHFFTSMREAHLHPYRLHVAIDYLEGCRECGGYSCARQCKKDARNVWILPAQSYNRLFVLDRSEVIRLNADANRVTDLELIRSGERHIIKARVVVLAAGAYFTPVLLLRSKSAQWPEGLGNQNDLVGRHLMFHASDFFAIWPKKKLSRIGPGRAIGLRDLYRAGDKNLGQLQSTGLTAGYGNILYAMNLRFDISPLRMLRFLRPFLRIPAKIASWFLREATVFANIIEDHPYPDNRILLDESSPSGMRLEYTIRPELENRVQFYRESLRRLMRGFRIMPLSVRTNLNFGHPCGTCRAGEDPRTSVVNAECRVHGIDNLYVVDGSIFPTSGGTNPSETIAANALRVASVINRRLRGKMSTSD